MLEGGESDSIWDRAIREGYNSCYVRDLRVLVMSASPGALSRCRARHGQTFGHPGHGGVVWVAGEIARAEREEREP